MKLWNALTAIFGGKHCEFSYKKFVGIVWPKKQESLPMTKKVLRILNAYANRICKSLKISNG